jgi:uncharacterized membrane protein YozB (DUF420 family)
MTKAPIVSTIIAIGLIPVAFLFLHAFISGIKQWKYHKFTGMLAIIWDLSMSIGYMIYRVLGGKMGNSTLDLSGSVLAYFIVHGMIALIVILLEIVILTSGILQWKQNKTIRLHVKLAKILFVLWWIAFLSGELFYLVLYVM